MMRMSKLIPTDNPAQVRGSRVEATCFGCHQKLAVEYRSITTSIFSDDGQPITAQAAKVASKPKSKVRREGENGTARQTSAHTVFPGRRLGTSASTATWRA